MPASVQAETIFHMADLNTDDQQKTSEEEGKKTAGDVQDTGKPDTAATGELSFTPAQQAHIDRVIEDRLSRQRAQHKRQQDEEKAKLDQQKLVEQGEFKALADQRAARIVELEAELQNREISTLRATVAARHKLPEHWISRLVGETEADIDADAARIAKDLAPPKAPNTEGGEKPAPTSAQTVQKRVEELRASGDYSAF